MFSADLCLFLALAATISAQQPPIRTYSGTFGSGATVTEIAADPAGNAYITGSVSPANIPPFPVTPGAFKTTIDYPYTGFVTKLNPSGDVILYSTFVSGQPAGIAVDAQGEAYITGTGGESGNYCGNLPSSGGFVLKLNSAGTAAVFGACVPGSPTAIALDATGAAYLTGTGTNIPVTGGAAQSKSSGAFVEKLDPSGATLTYATYLGGSSGSEKPAAIAVDSAGNAYITGTALSSDFPVANAYQSSPGMSPLMRTADGGITYTSASIGLPPGAAPSLIAPNPGNPSVVYAAIQSQNSLQLYVTNNAGASWKLLAPLPSGVSQLLPDPQNATTLYSLAATNQGYLYKSIDGGLTWKQLTVANGIPIVQLIVDPRNSSILYAVGANSPASVFKSTDGGSTWQQLTVGVNTAVSSIAMDPTNSATLFAIAASAFWKSTDAGAHWIAGTSLNQAGKLLVARSNPSVMYATSSNASFVTLDGGVTWSSIPNQAPFAISMVDANDPATFYAFGYGAEQGQLIRTRLSGSTVKSTDTLMTDVNAAIFDNGSPASLYLAISASRDAFVSKLNPTGTQWVYSTYFGGYGSDIASAIAVDAQGNAYIAGTTNSTNLPVSTSAVQKTFAGGTGTWTLAFPNFVSPAGDAFLAKLDPSGSKLLACTYLGGSAHDAAVGLALDSAGSVYLAGTTLSPNFPLTADSPASPVNFPNGSFLAQLSGDFTRLNDSQYADQQTFTAVTENETQGILLAGHAGNGAVLFTDLHFGPPSPLPQIATGGIVDVFSGQPKRAVPGSIESVFGINLAASGQSAAGVPLPLSLAGINVTVDGVAAPLFYAGPNQINVQVPYETKPGVSQLVVTTPAGISLPAAMIVTTTAPNILVDLNTNRAIALNQDNTYNSPANPAPSGSTITLFLTGQGAVANPPPTGAAASGPAAATVAATAQIGKASAVISYLGLTPGSVGLAQANIVIPQLTASEYPLLLTVNGVVSNWSTVSIGGKQ